MGRIPLELDLLDNIHDTTARRLIPPLLWVIYLFLNHHPDGLTGPFALPVPYIVGVPLQPLLSNVCSAEHCGSPSKPRIPSAFAVHMASVAVGVVLLLGVQTSTAGGCDLAVLQ